MTTKLGDSEKVCLAATIAFFVGSLCPLVDLLAAALWVPVIMPWHELGHAMAHWFSGAIAIPTFFLTVTLGEPSYTVALAVFLLLVGASFYLFKYGSRITTGGLIALAFVQFFIAFLAPTSLQKQFGIAGGLAGEALFAPLILSLSLESYTPWWRRNRIFFVCSAMAALGNALAGWIAIILRYKPLPYGSLLMGEEAGDINVLMSDFGWSEEGLMRLFLSIALVSFVVCCTRLLIEAGYVVDRGSSARTSPADGAKR